MSDLRKKSMISDEAKQIIMAKINEIQLIEDPAKRQLIYNLYKEYITQQGVYEVEQIIKNCIDEEKTQTLFSDDDEYYIRLIREEKEQEALQAIESLYWYDRDLLKLYMKLGNYRAMEKATGIPYSSCFKTVQKAVKEIREKIGLPAPLDKPTKKDNKEGSTESKI